MGDESKVILHGMWASPYMKRVEIALKLKAIPFEYVEEDLSNKSPLLLKYNPVYKKVPVLVHNGKPISESLLIVEYIDEVWNDGPRILPEEPYERARVRFWADYIQKVFNSMSKIFNSEGEELTKACDEFYEKLKVLEDGIKDLFPGGDPRAQGRNLGLLDVLIVPTLGAYKAQEQVLGVKILDPERNPLMYSWVNSLLELPLIQEIAPPYEKVVALLQMLKEMGVKFEAN
nr:glutathione S-transferase U9-like [Ipomoea batatas]